MKGNYQQNVINQGESLNLGKKIKINGFMISLLMKTTKRIQHFNMSRKEASTQGEIIEMNIIGEIASLGQEQTETDGDKISNY